MRSEVDGDRASRTCDRVDTSAARRKVCGAEAELMACFASLWAGADVPVHCRGTFQLDAAGLDTHGAGVGSEPWSHGHHHRGAGDTRCDRIGDSANKTSCCCRADPLPARGLSSQYPSGAGEPDSRGQASHTVDHSRSDAGAVYSSAGGLRQARKRGCGPAAGSESLMVCPRTWRSTSN